jgi:tRNA A37 methylthiotransferase MiaB
LASENFHSFPEEQIIRNFKKGLKEKYKNFALVAGDIGCYGVDIDTNLPSLLKKLFAVDGNYKLILEDLNARWLVKYYPELLSVLKTNFGKVSRIVFPVQSGSDTILKLMNRGYEIAEVKNCILDLHKRVPKMKLGTHIIVGFPGETDEDFQKSIALIRTRAFSYVSVFCYENRPNTQASKLPFTVDKETIAKRVKLNSRS